MGTGEFTNSVTGTNYLGVKLTQQPSNTLGALVTVRYIKSPLVGFEFNYGYARYTQNYSNYINGGAQTNANEYTVGYVAHTPKILGIGTFVSGGAGSMSFKGTPGGGQGLPTQARAAYYYAAGFEDSILSPHFGIRAQFRQVFLSRSRLWPELPDHQAAPDHVGTRHRLLSEVLTRTRHCHSGS